MKKRSNILKLTAILTIMAWANVQVMACCWSFGAKAVATAEVSSGHDCCHKTSASVSVVPDEADLISTAGNSCCNHDQTPAVQSSAPSLDVAVVAGIGISKIEFPSSTSFHRATVYRNSGPPSSLVFQRLLI